VKGRSESAAPQRIQPSDDSPSANSGVVVVAPQVADLERTLTSIGERSTNHADQAFALHACREAITAVYEGNYGVGALLIDPSGRIAERGHNVAFEPSFRSDLHAEMVVMNAFEERHPKRDSMAGYTLICSLEPCPMCLARLLIAGVETVKFIANDELGGMVDYLHQLPAAWQRLAERVEFRRADTSDELRRLASDVFLLNLDGLRRKLWAR
jgi:cytosine deaminase